MMRAEAQDREAVVAEARSWIGTSYHHHGRLKGVGVDCAQLLCEVFERMGLIPHVDPGNYPTDWHMHRGEELFSNCLAQHANRRDGERPDLGDVFLFKFGRTFSHGSIYVGNESVVHAYIGRGVEVCRFTEEPLEGREMQHWSFW